MLRDAGKCYIEFKETDENLSCFVVSRFDARSLFLRVEAALCRGSTRKVLSRNAVFPVAVR